VGQEVAPQKLALAGLSKWFGGLRAVGACSFEIAPGTVVGLIGPNGSGKSTLFDLVTGLLQPDEGAILHDGDRIDGLALTRSRAAASAARSSP
jgi:ABC-type branched-subunit amino acid transport system ATPase component